MRPRCVDSRAIWVLAASLGIASVSNAAPTFVVNSLADAPASADVYDGVCETFPGNGVCTLRAAVMEANGVQGDGGATIRVPAGTYFLTIAPVEGGRDENGDLDILKPVTITGDGQSATVIDGNHLTRVFFTAAPDVVVQGLTIAHGKITGLSLAAGIANQGGLLLENVRVTGNEGSIGGGVYNQGTLTVRHCRIDSNSSVNSGGGIETNETALVQDSLIQGNSAAYGGGVSNSGDLTIERTALVGNLSGNTYGDGGAVYSDTSTETLVMVNDEVYGNGSVGEGGGIFVYRGAATLIHVTVTANLANSDGNGSPPVGGGGPSGGGIGVHSLESSVFLKNSLVTGNLSLYGSSYLPDECGPYATLSGDYNIRGAWLSCLLTGQTTYTNTSNVDPALGPLAFNGGFTWNQDSGYGPGLRAIPVENCTDRFGGTLTTDFRGYWRRDRCDIGAHQALSDYAPPSPLGNELVRNGGAADNELGGALSAAEPSFDQGAAYWLQPGGRLLQVLYGTAGGYPTKDDAPAGSGSGFLSGGNEAVAYGVQYLDVSSIAAAIDAGTLRYRVAGAFGGFETDEDKAELSVKFQSEDSDLATLTLGGFSALDRGNATKLLRDTKSGFVPVGTRYVVLGLTATRYAGANNDGYADDISLVLPEPAPLASGAAALGALAARRRRLAAPALRSAR